MKQKNSDISELAFRSFVRASGLFRNTMRPYFARFGISGAQWGIMRQLYRAEGEGLKGLRLAELGLRLLVKPPSITTLVDGLERRGLVIRMTAAEDQRAKNLALTRTGRSIVTRILKEHPTQMRAILAGLTESEQRKLHDLMQKFAAHLESLENAAPAKSKIPRPLVEKLK